VPVQIFWEFDGPDKCEPGDVASYELRSTDSNGKPIDVIVNTISGNLLRHNKTRGVCEEKGKISKISAGTYRIDFYPHVIGKHQVLLQNGHITLFKNTQIVLDVAKPIPTETLNYEFEIEGTGLLAGRVNDHLYFNLVVTENGIPKDLPPNKFSVKVFGNGKTSLAENTRTGVGAYQISFTSSTPGIFTATVLYEEAKVLKQRLDFFCKTLAISLSSL